MQGHLTELYGVEVSPDLISTVTDAVLEEVTAWQQQPLLALYPVFPQTTVQIESLHMQLRKILKTRGHFPSDEAATKLLYLALRNIVRRWKAAPREWKAAMNQFAILHPDRFTVAG